MIDFVVVIVVLLCYNLFNHSCLVEQVAVCLDTDSPCLWIDC